MGVIQISTKLENRPGELSRLSELLGGEGVNLLALMVATHFDEGLLRCVPDDPAKAARVLEANGYEIESKEILAVQTPHHPGGLNAVLKPLKEAGINVDHLYPCIGATSNGQTVLMLGVSDLLKARQALRQNWIIILGDELYQL